MSGTHDAQMEEDAEMIAEVASIADDLSDYLDDDEQVERLRTAVRTMRDRYFERYGETVETALARMPSEPEGQNDDDEVDGCYITFDHDLVDGSTTCRRCGAEVSL